MKSLILLLLPIVLFAQIPHPDTLTLSNGKKYSCLITGIGDSKVEMIYLNSKKESVIYNAIDQISIDKLGVIFIAGRGFTQEKEDVKEFIDKRNKEMEDEKIVQKELERLALVSSGVQNENRNDYVIIHTDNQKSLKQWSFGVLLIPYYSGTRYRVIHYIGQYPPQVTTLSYADNEINMESQLSFGVTSNVRLTFDAAYSSTFSELRSEFHSRSEYNNYDSGYLTTSGLDIVDFSLGVKYYFISFVPNNVSIYALASIGKQFAFAEEDYENLFPGPGPTPIIEDNFEEYIEGLNSPWHFNFGFGAEYLFNESLSLNSNIRFIYASISSEYDYRYISEFETVTQSIDYSNSEFITRIGLGLNFYF